MKKISGSAALIFMLSFFKLSNVRQKIQYCNAKLVEHFFKLRTNVELKYILSPLSGILNWDLTSSAKMICRVLLTPQYCLNRKTNFHITISYRKDFNRFKGNMTYQEEIIIRIHITVFLFKINPFGGI